MLTVVVRVHEAVLWACDGQKLAADGEEVTKPHLHASTLCMDLV